MTQIKVLKTLRAGPYPEVLLAACARLEVQPESLLDWAVRRGEVALVLENGMKVRVAVEGRWGAPAEKRPSGRKAGA